MSKIVQFKDKTTGEEIYPIVDDASTLIINSSIRQIESELSILKNETPSLSYALGADSSHFYVLNTKYSNGAMLLGNDYYMYVGNLNNYNTIFNSSIAHVKEVIENLWNIVIKS